YDVRTNIEGQKGLEPLCRPACGSQEAVLLVCFPRTSKFLPSS
ncbi:hypothetical protein A2U01_0055703, partial [Trifolium medium]|nr:hypothetical protein [Trifolium medium]